jgi:hypothetical protein
VGQDTEAAQRLPQADARKGPVQDLPMRLRRPSRAAGAHAGVGARFVMDRREYMVINARDVTETERARLEREAILEQRLDRHRRHPGPRFVLANPHFEQISAGRRAAWSASPGACVWPDGRRYENSARFGPRLAAASRSSSKHRRTGATAAPSWPRARQGHRPGAPGRRRHALDRART